MSFMSNEPSGTQPPVPGQIGDPEFRRHLYRGTAGYYDRFRVPYPRPLIDDLAERSGAGGDGRLLDLACGTGQLAFALCDRFADVLAIDAEPDMADLVGQKACAAGIGNITWQACEAENLSAPRDSFDLVTIGSAFHRVQRGIVAANVFQWLRPGRCLALVWGATPWHGDTPWQHALSQTMDRWMVRARALDRIPAGHQQARTNRPDAVILREAGFEQVGTFECDQAVVWTPQTLAGFVFSTSVLSHAALGDLAPAFEEDLRREILASEPAGEFRQSVRFSYELARRPC